MKNPDSFAGNSSFFDGKVLNIHSRDNQKLKIARAVRDGRERHKIFVEGLRLSEEILKTDLKIYSVILTEKFAESVRGPELLKILVERGAELIKVEDKIFDSLSDTKQSQGIVIIGAKPESGKEIIDRTLQRKSLRNPLFILLHQLNNPSNLGAVLRTAEAVGIDGIITTRNTTDIYSAKSLRGAMGASFRLPAWTNADFFTVLEWARQNQIRSVCADVKSSKTYLEIDWKQPGLLILGSEGHGLTDDELQATDESLIIPMENGVESLNVAVAGGIILFEAKRQRAL